MRGKKDYFSNNNERNYKHRWVDGLGRTTIKT